ncbi:tRNA-splicing endonuclease subunit [Lignoscripta atroalba]|nr:tRNA-splicing endonuclease subunit [Lignoscripta atroalba]
MVSSTKPTPPSLPFPIFRVSTIVERYLLYDIDIITWLRKSHHILGVLIGTLPQIPQQNVFLGLPLELMPEEARLLVEKSLAYILDDLDWHVRGLQSTTLAQRHVYKEGLAREGREAAKAAETKKQERTSTALTRMQLGNSSRKRSLLSNDHNEPNHVETDDSESLFASPVTEKAGATVAVSSSSIASESWTITPTCSYPPLPSPQNPTKLLPDVRPSLYALFSHLHERGYFLSPGLRFGCQYLVYPGDPLRFHSHFLAMGADWDEEINLLDLVGGGRLGTGVKKGWLIGGTEEGARDGTHSKNQAMETGHHENGEEDRSSEELTKERTAEGPKLGVRTFCIEWGGM